MKTYRTLIFRLVKSFLPILIIISILIILKVLDFLRIDASITLKSERMGLSILFLIGLICLFLMIIFIMLSKLTRVKLTEKSLSYSKGWDYIFNRYKELYLKDIKSLDIHSTQKSILSFFPKSPNQKAISLSYSGKDKYKTKTIILDLNLIKEGLELGDLLQDKINLTRASS